MSLSNPQAGWENVGRASTFGTATCSGFVVNFPGLLGEKPVYTFSIKKLLVFNRSTVKCAKILHAVLQYKGIFRSRSQKSCTLTSLLRENKSYLFFSLFIALYTIVVKLNLSV